MMTLCSVRMVNYSRHLVPSGRQLVESFHDLFSNLPRGSTAYLFVW